MGTYQVNCPFCGTEQEMTDSEYQYTGTGCSECGAGFNCDNWDKSVNAITELPRTECSVEVRGEQEFAPEEIDSLDEAVEQLFDTVSENPEELLEVVRRKQAVSEDTVREVLQEGIHGDGVGISSAEISASEIEEFGVEVPQ